MRMFAIEVGEDHKAELVLREAQEVHGESLPRAGMFEYGMTVGAADAPAEAIAVGFSIVKVRAGVHLLVAGLLQEFLVGERGVPLGHIENVRVEGAIGGGVQLGR